MFAWLRSRKASRDRDADDRREAANDEALAWVEGHAMQYPRCAAQHAVWGPIWVDEQRAFTVGCRLHRHDFDYYIED